MKDTSFVGRAALQRSLEQANESSFTLGPEQWPYTATGMAAMCAHARAIVEERAERGALTPAQLAASAAAMQFDQWCYQWQEALEAHYALGGCDDGLPGCYASAYASLL